MYEWANEMNCAVTVCDTEGVILYMNEKACDSVLLNGISIDTSRFKQFTYLVLRLRVMTIK